MKNKLKTVKSFRVWISRDGYTTEGRSSVYMWKTKPEYGDLFFSGDAILGSDGLAEKESFGLKRGECRRFEIRIIEKEATRE